MLPVIGSAVSFLLINFVRTENTEKLANFNSKVKIFHNIYIHFYKYSITLTNALI